jgi:GMP synthase (glutamine-hydrolysing)
MKKLYIIKAGTTFPNILEKFGDFDKWTLEALGDVEIETSILDVENGAELPKAKDCAGVVITGSHAMVTEKLPWSVRLERWIPSLIEAKTPFFGICYGHQLLAEATGGEVGFHKMGKEIGTVEVELVSDYADDHLFKELPNSFSVHATHAQTVLKLPKGARRLAANSYEPNHVFCVGECAWGVQFHPEYNVDIMCAYIEAQEKDLQTKGTDIKNILGSVDDTPVASQVFRNFAHFVEDRL